MNTMPPLDTHAHVDPGVSSRELEDLGAVVLIATRSLADFKLVQERQDLVSVWGVGCHPSLVGVQKAFIEEDFREALKKTPFIAEVGLDGSSRVPVGSQIGVLKTILSATHKQPRIVSLHSYKATAELVNVLRQEGGQPGRILHWWLGTDDETAEMLQLGCYFSINYSMLRAPGAWTQVPLDRILLETDHPSGDRFSSQPRQPGSVSDVEKLLAKRFQLTPHQIRVQCWKNFAAVVESTRTDTLMPRPVQRMIAAARARI
ncbi:TatD family deoxyribonuclease [Arthrobacter sp. YN]|nr:TatD family deoxyribonuclease [Arthrobacter sp. YN]